MAAVARGGRGGGLPHETGVGMLRGNHPARIDDKGRLKIPNGFRSLVVAQ